MAKLPVKVKACALQYITCRKLTTLPLSSGTQLPRCISDEQQCCTANYIERVEEKVTTALQEFLAEEFDDVIEDYLDDIENLIDCKYTCLKYRNSTLCIYTI